MGNPLKLTLRQLISEYDNVTYPVTLVCAGNRRKEQNQVRKSKGFSWGAAGVSTALFTGVVMADVIRRAKPMRGARYVCMEGADKLVRDWHGAPPMYFELTKAAERLLWDLCQAELGHGCRSRYDVGTQDEWRDTTTGPW